MLETEEDYSNDSEQRFFILSLLEQWSWTLLLAFGRDSKQGRGLGNLHSGEKGPNTLVDSL